MVALSSKALTTLAAVKEELSITSSTDDDYLTRLINRTSIAFASYCNRAFETAALVEKQPGMPGMLLYVDRPPITTLTSIAYADGVIASTNYEIQDANAGTIFVIGGVQWTAPQLMIAAPVQWAGRERKLWTITYTGGYALPAAATPTLPDDLEGACILNVVQLYRQRGKDRTIKGESLLGYSVQYAGVESSSEVGDSLFSDEVCAVLKRYRRIVV